MLLLVGVQNTGLMRKAGWFYQVEQVLSAEGSGSSFALINR